MSTIRRFSLCFLLLIIPFVTLAQKCNDATLSTTLHLQDNANGTVNAPKTELIWKKCSEGQSWDAGSNSCVGSVIRYTWAQALQRAKDVNNGTEGENLGKSDWRVPNSKELSSIVELKCWDPSISISVFPSTPSWWYWSSSPYASYSNNVWFVNFNDGGDGSGSKSFILYVRLVRSEQ